MEAESLRPLGQWINTRDLAGLAMRSAKHQEQVPNNLSCRAPLNLNISRAMRVAYLAVPESARQVSVSNTLLVNLELKLPSCTISSVLLSYTL